MLKEVYTDPPQTSMNRSLVASASIWGAIIGQLLFGYLADAIGRNVIGKVTLALIMVGAIASAFAFESDSFSIYYQLMIYLFILGKHLRICSG